MKKRHLTLVICVLSCLALVGIGFASWIITRPTETVEQTGSFIVDDVNVEGVELKFNSASNDGKIIFGYNDNNQGQEGKWLTNNDVTKKENLTVTFTFDVEGVSKLKTADNAKEQFEIDLAIVESDSSTTNANIYKAVSDANYITSFDSVKSGITASLSTDSGDKGTLTITVTFAWGSKFQNNNPFIYFNGLENNDTNRQAAKTALESIKTLENLTYKLTVKPVLATN